MLPEGWVEHNELKESDGSRRGDWYATASGEPLYNLGEKDLVLSDENGEMRSMKFQVAKVTKALGSVSQICSNGNRGRDVCEGPGRGHKSSAPISPQHRGVCEGNQYVLAPLGKNRR